MNLKNILLFGILITLFACSKESVSNPEENTSDNTLIKKIIYNMGTNDEYIEIFSYDDNKLTSIDAGDGYYSNYTYENNQLVKEEQFFDGELAEYTILEYNSDNKVSMYTENWLEPSGIDGLSYKHIITYNNDNTFTDKIYRSDSGSQFELNFTETITLEGNNISTVAETDYQISYTYDDKNGIYKNVFAIEVLNLLAENEFGASIYGNTNNITSYTESSNNITNVETYEYTYNENGYPKTAILKSEYDGNIEEDETIDFFYE